MRAEARIAVIGILTLNLSVSEFVGLQQLTPRSARQPCIYRPRAPHR